LIARLLLDTHIVIRWLAEPQKLSRSQLRAVEHAASRSEPVAISDVTLLEIAVLLGEGSHRINSNIEDLFTELQDSPFFQILPLTYEIAAEVAAVGGSLRDPADRAIVATARVHRLKLVTSDQRIIESKLVAVVE
jgi:PIN domain nuclease of toxin-antitoxin system